MKELLDVLKKVKDRIHKYREKLQKNEMLTRYVLIDPILRALGWDTEDANQVIPEIQVSQGRPDYALLYNQKTLVMIEAKALGTNIDEYKEVGFKYCWQNKVPYFIITDGDIWELQDLSEMGGRQIFRVQISKDDLGSVARKLLAIWKEATPNIEPATDSIIYSSNLKSSIPKHTPKLTLSELKKKNFSNKKLSAILYLGKDKIEVSKWKDLLVKVASFALPYLQKRGELPLGEIIKDQKKDMLSPKELDGKWFVETNYSANYCVRNLLTILEKAGINPHIEYNEDKDRNLVKIKFWM